MRILTGIIIAVSAFTSAVGQDYSKGKYLLETEQLNSAKKYFAEMAKNAPADSKALFFLGETYYRQNKTDSAKIFFQKASELDPKSNLNQAGMAKILYKSNPAEGKAALDKIVSQLKSKDTETPVYIADFFISEKEADKALAALSGQMEGDVKTPEIYLAAGDGWLLKNDGSKALEFYERKALSLNQDYPATLLRIGRLYTKTRNLELALQYFNKAAEKDPGYAPAHKEAAEVFYKAGQYKKAIASYQKYMAIADKDPESDYRYASFLFLNKDYQGALKYLTDLTATAEHKDNFYLYRLLAYSNFETGNTDKANENIEIFFTKVAPNKIIASDYEYRGKIQNKKGNNAEALTNLKKALELDPANISLYSEIGNIYLAQKNFSEAALSYEGKLKKSAGNPNEYLNYGKSVFYQQDFKKADSVFTILATKIPDLPHGHLWRAKALEQTDPDMKQALAKPHYEKFVEISEKEKDKYKNDFINACSYLGSYYATAGDMPKSALYWQKVKEVDPTNKNAAEALKNYK